MGEESTEREHRAVDLLGRTEPCASPTLLHFKALIACRHTTCQRSGQAASKAEGSRALGRDNHRSRSGSHHDLLLRDERRLLVHRAAAYTCRAAARMSAEEIARVRKRAWVRVGVKVRPALQLTPATKAAQTPRQRAAVPWRSAQRVSEPRGGRGCGCGEVARTANSLGGRSRHHAGVERAERDARARQAKNAGDQADHPRRGATVPVHATRGTIRGSRSGVRLAGGNTSSWSTVRALGRDGASAQVLTSRGTAAAA